MQLIEGEHDLETITSKIADINVQWKMPLPWYVLLLIAGGGVSLLGASVGWLLWQGIGVWGVNIPVGWGFAIINLVWWIGIGHAGTLISAILFLLNQDWRTAINRYAEAMTIFAVMCAGMFPLLHVGRPWAVFFILPLPNTMGLWPQFRSPLIWDVFAISTYASVSIVFWYIGLIPDLATLRDRVPKGPRKIIYGIAALGWRGSARHWFRYEYAYLLLAGLATPLVVSVHSVISLDFSVSLIPGWHTTIFPPYFVAGAIYSGFAMVLTLMIPTRAWFGLHDFITEQHLNLMSKVMLATGLIVTYGYGCEAFYAWYSGNGYEKFMMFDHRWFGAGQISYIGLILFNCTIPQLLWFKKFRVSPVPLFILTIVINIGMWLERYVIVVGSLTRDYLPSSWGNYTATIWDWGLYIGTMGFFLMMICLFLKFLPVISIAEAKHTWHQEKEIEAHLKKMQAKKA